MVATLVEMLEKTWGQLPKREIAPCKRHIIPDNTLIFGASNRNRTGGLRFTRAPLYLLSYAGWMEDPMMLPEIFQKACIAGNRLKFNLYDRKWSGTGNQMAVITAVFF